MCLIFLSSLADILEGSVGMLNNYNLCHIKTINWKEIITGQNAKYMYVYKFQEAERDCTPCNSACEAGCWGEGAKKVEVSTYVRKNQISTQGPLI